MTLGSGRALSIGREDGTALKSRIWDPTVKVHVGSSPELFLSTSLSVLSLDEIRSALNPLDLDSLTPWLHEYPWEVQEHRGERGCLSWFS